MNKALLAIHLLGLALGLSVSFSSLVMGGLIDKAAPNEKAILQRFPPAMMRLGHTGLALLWITGPIMLFTKHNGFVGMPWTFHVKLTAVIVLSACVGMIGVNMKKGLAGDMAAMARVRTIGKVALLSALTALVFAVITFD